jgi:hypothetical protein
MSQDDRYVSFTGPEPDQNSDGDEVPVWSIAIMTDDEEILEDFNTYTYNDGLTLAQHLSQEHHLELVAEADRS